LVKFQSNLNLKGSVSSSPVSSIDYSIGVNQSHLSLNGPITVELNEPIKLIGDENIMSRLYKKP